MICDMWIKAQAYRHVNVKIEWQNKKYKRVIQDNLVSMPEFDRWTDPPSGLVLMRSKFNSLLLVWIIWSKLYIHFFYLINQNFYWFYDKDMTVYVLPLSKWPYSEPHIWSSWPLHHNYYIFTYCMFNSYKLSLNIHAHWILFPGMLMSVRTRICMCMM